MSLVGGLNSLRRPTGIDVDLKERPDAILIPGRVQSGQRLRIVRVNLPGTAAVGKAATTGVQIEL